MTQTKIHCFLVQANLLFPSSFNFESRLCMYHQRSLPTYRWIDLGQEMNVSLSSSSTSTSSSDARYILKGQPENARVHSTATQSHFKQTTKIIALSFGPFTGRFKGNQGTFRQIIGTFTFCRHRPTICRLPSTYLSATSSIRHKSRLLSWMEQPK